MPEPDAAPGSRDSSPPRAAPGDVKKSDSSSDSGNTTSGCGCAVPIWCIISILLFVFVFITVVPTAFIDDSSDRVKYCFISSVLASIGFIVVFQIFVGSALQDLTESTQRFVDMIDCIANSKSRRQSDGKNIAVMPTAVTVGDHIITVASNEEDPDALLKAFPVSSHLCDLRELQQRVHQIVDGFVNGIIRSGATYSLLLPHSDDVGKRAVLENPVDKMMVVDDEKGEHHDEKEHDPFWRTASQNRSQSKKSAAASPSATAQKEPFAEEAPAATQEKSRSVSQQQQQQQQPSPKKKAPSSSSSSPSPARQKSREPAAPAAASPPQPVGDDLFHSDPDDDDDDHQQEMLEEQGALASVITVDDMVTCLSGVAGPSPSPPRPTTTTVLPEQLLTGGERRDGAHRSSSQSQPQPQQQPPSERSRSATATSRQPSAASPQAVAPLRARSVRDEEQQQVASAAPPKTSQAAQDGSDAVVGQQEEEEQKPTTNVFTVSREKQSRSVSIVDQWRQDSQQQQHRSASQSQAQSQQMLQRGRSTSTSSSSALLRGPDVTPILSLLRYQRGRRFPGDSIEIPFFIARSKNQNVVVFEAKYDKNGDIALSNSLDAYWLDVDPTYMEANRARRRLTDRSELTPNERALAYGVHVTSDPDDEGFGPQFTARFVALPTRPMKLSLLSRYARGTFHDRGSPFFRNSIPILRCKIAGEDNCIAERLFLHCTGGESGLGPARVTQVELHGFRSDTLESVVEVMMTA